MKNILILIIVLICHSQGVSQTIDFALVGAKWWVNQIVLEPIPADSYTYYIPSWMVEKTHS
jgi:hypothetical protein